MILIVACGGFLWVCIAVCCDFVFHSFLGWLLDFSAGLVRDCGFAFAAGLFCVGGFGL